ncbi:hypothetical protein HKCCE3408_01060 [Rhodobacterales bacterium HKCCE3408]|nr:hypothetical protein [Rhodobacterales bacterium HKCCE3408]
MEINKQMFSSITGVLIVLGHVLLLCYLWVSFGAPTGGGTLKVTEISTPITAAFALGVVKWIIDTQGRITSEKKVGVPYVVIFGVILLALAFGVVWGLNRYSKGEWQPDQLNQFFVIIESGMGGMFGLFFNDMFGPAEDQTK